MWMRAVTKPLDEQAQSIFAELGYTVTERGTEYLAERKWRVVHVTPVVDFEDIPTSGDLRCFVTWDDETTDLERKLDRADPEYEWAIIGVDDDGGYRVESGS
jgi:hypothetical protein